MPITNSQSQLISKKWLPEYAFDFHDVRVPIRTGQKSTSLPVLRITPLPPQGIYIPAQRKCRSKHSLRKIKSLAANVTPIVLYYRLKRTIGALESLDSADLCSDLYSSSDMRDALKFLLGFLIRPLTKSASLGEDPRVAGHEVHDCLETEQSSLRRKHRQQVNYGYPNMLQEAFNLRPPFWFGQLVITPGGLYLQWEQLDKDLGGMTPQIIQPEPLVSQYCNDGIQFLHPFRWQSQPSAGDNVHHCNGTPEKSIHKGLQDIMSEVHNSLLPNEIDLWDIPINYSNLWSRKKLAMWKVSYGRSKEWRSCRFVKAIKKYLTEKFFVRKDWPTKISWKHSPPTVPINMLRRDKSSQLKFRTRPRKGATPDFRYLAQETLWGDSDSGTDDSRNEYSSGPLESASFNAANPELAHPANTEATFPDLALPYENFVGAVIGASFRILKFLRSENHGDVYAVEDLSPTANRYEAKAYILRGLPERTRNYRVRNLKKLTSKPSFICSFDQQGRKFVINRLGEKLEEERIAFSQENEINTSNLGAVGRRNTPEFDEAFPKLPTISNTRIAESSIHIRTDCLLATLEPYMWKQAGISLMPMETSELLNLIIRNYSSVLQKGLPDEASTPKMGISVLEDVEQEKGKKASKKKTPQQIERDRARQRMSRMRRRAQRNAGRAMEEGNGPERHITAV